MSTIQVASLVPVQARLALGEVEADPLDLYLNFNPQLLEVVDTNADVLAGFRPKESFSHHRCVLQ